MKPAAFDYAAPGTLDEALGLLARHGANAKVIAGGQSFVPMANFRLLRPELVVDLNRIPSLAYLKETGDGLSVGAMTRHREFEHSDLVRRACPLLAEAVPNIAHAVIRNRGTIGGSLAHADPAAEWPVVAVALGATMVLRNAKGERLVAARDFFVALMTTALAPEDILVEIRFPRVPPKSGAAFLEVSRRHGDFALVAVAAQLTLDAAGKIAQGRLALGGVSVTPVDANADVASLAGRSPDTAAFAALGERIAARLQPNEDLHASAQYRREVAAVLVRRALDAATVKAKAA